MSYPYQLRLNHYHTKLWRHVMNYTYSYVILYVPTSHFSTNVFAPRLIYTHHFWRFSRNTAWRITKSWLNSGLVSKHLFLTQLSKDFASWFWIVHPCFECRCISRKNDTLWLAFWNLVSTAQLYQTIILSYIFLAGCNFEGFLPFQLELEKGKYILGEWSWAAYHELEKEMIQRYMQSIYKRTSPFHEEINWADLHKFLQFMIRL